MPLYLAILLSIFCGLGTLLIIYLFFVFRRFSITTRKIDYLIEDITFKSETLAPMIDSLVKLSSYINVLDIAIKRNSSSIEKVIKNNRDSIQKFNKQLQKALLDEHIK